MNTHNPNAEHPDAPRSTLHAPRFSGFTLIEMIVVIGIIAILAALIIPISGAAKKARDLSRVRTELTLVAHAIDGYKDKLGHYPPDNAVATDPLRYEHAPLFYELRGTFQTNGNLQTLDGSLVITPAAVKTAFGTGGFINCTAGGGDESRPAQRFMSDLQAGQFADTTVNGVTCRLLGCSFDGPYAFSADPSSPRKFTPWFYNSSSPTNNANSYDLWVDIKIGSKVYRVSNWSTRPQVF